MNAVLGAFPDARLIRVGGLQDLTEDGGAPGSSGSSLPRPVLLTLVTDGGAQLIIGINTHL